MTLARRHEMRIRTPRAARRPGSGRAARLFLGASIVPFLLAGWRATAQEQEIRSHMDDHFERITAVEKAIIQGDLKAARISAAELADPELSAGAPEAWKPFLEDVQALARELVGAEELADASVASAKLVAACGSCHMGTSQGPALSETPDIAGGEELPEHMTRHAWAVGRMREGLVGPADANWMAGAFVLTEEPLQPDAVSGELAAERIRILEERVHALGMAAYQADDRSDRVLAYARLLQTCARCHDLVE